MDATEHRLAVYGFPGGGDSSLLRPLVSADAAPFFEALQARRFVLQACAACGRTRWPAAPACPHCGGGTAAWQPASGRGTVHSFARYHKAFLPAFEPLLPYTVLNVALVEGPRMIGRWLGAGDVAIGMPVAVAVERWDDGLCVAAFEAVP